MEVHCVCIVRSFAGIVTFICGVMRFSLQIILGCDMWMSVCIKQEMHPISIR